MTQIRSRAVYAIIAAVLVLCGMAYFKSSNTNSGRRCLDTATAKPALDEAASKIGDAVRAAKSGDTTTAASYMRSAARSLRTAANASSADSAVSQPLMMAAGAYDKAGTAYVSGDETGAALYATDAIASLKTSNQALRESSVPRCQ